MHVCAQSTSPTYSCFTLLYLLRVTLNAKSLRKDLRFLVNNFSTTDLRVETVIVLQNKGSKNIARLAGKHP